VNARIAATGVVAVLSKVFTVTTPRARLCRDSR
jgi:hypothetical protein